MVSKIFYLFGLWPLLMRFRLNLLLRPAKSILHLELLNQLAKLPKRKANQKIIPSAELFKRIVLIHSALNNFCLVELSRVPAMDSTWCEMIFWAGNLILVSINLLCSAIFFQVRPWSPWYLRYFPLRADPGEGGEASRGLWYNVNFLKYCPITTYCKARFVCAYQVCMLWVHVQGSVSWSL